MLIRCRLSDTSDRDTGLTTKDSRSSTTRHETTDPRWRGVGSRVVTQLVIGAAKSLAEAKKGVSQNEDLAISAIRKALGVA